MSFTLKAAKGDDFINRKEIINEIVTTISGNSRIGFALYGSRRVGKTSIFKEVQRKLKSNEDIVVIYFSVWEVMPKTITNFVRYFSDTVLEAYRYKIPIKRRVVELVKYPVEVIRDYLRDVKISAKVMDEIEFLLTFDDKKEKNYGDLIRRAFDLPEKLAAETNTKCVILMDEFPSIVDLKNESKIGQDVIGVIRTLYEDQKNTVLCVSGSIRKTMEISVLSSISPFYRQFIVREIKPLSKDNVDELLKKNCRKEIDEKALEKIFEFTKGIPFYVQLLGKRIDAVECNKITCQEIKQVIADTLEEEGAILFNSEFFNLSAREQKIIIAMSTKNLHSPGDIAKETKEETSTISTYLIYLQEKGFITKRRKGIYSIDDLVFEKWIAWKYG